MKREESEERRGELNHNKIIGMRLFTLENVSLFQLLSSGSLAQSSVGKQTKNYFPNLYSTNNHCKIQLYVLVSVELGFSVCGCEGHYRVSAVPICVRMASHCSLLCHDRPMCSALACLSGACLSGAEGRLLSFSASVSFLFTLLARAPAARTYIYSHKPWLLFTWTDV